MSIPYRINLVFDSISGIPSAELNRLIGTSKGAWALMGSAVLMEIPIAMVVASRLLPFRANRLANIIAGFLLTLVNGFLTFVPPLVGWGKPPALPEYLFFATIETVATSVIIWQAWTWSGVEAAVSSERRVRQPQAGIISS